MRLTFAALSALLLLAAACTITRTSGGTPITRSTLGGLAAASDLIVVGAIRAEAGTRNLARDPKDLSREDPTMVGLGQDYVIEVESTIKGEATPTIVVSLARWHGPRGQAPREDSDFIPLEKGTRYVLFLQRSRAFAGIYVPAPEPFRFKLTDQARAESFWPDAQQHFPPTDVSAFIGSVRAAAGSQR